MKRAMLALGFLTALAAPAAAKPPAKKAAAQKK
jgi:hypothetical protein